MTRDGSVIAVMCLAEVLTMTGVFAFPALLPTFVESWTLSNTEAGWIAGIYFAGYAAAVPVLMTLTDRIDAKRVYLGGAVLAAATSLVFAVLADGFWTGLLFRALAGIALAATYMPGLRVIIDRFRGPSQSRAVALYTASFSLATAISFFIAGEVADAFGWRWAFAAAGVAAAVAIALVATLPPVTPEPAHAPTRLLDFRPVLRNPAAMGYVLGYGVHCWELFTLRSWLVALLAFTVAQAPLGIGSWPSPTSVAMLSALVAMLASVGGNELCVRFGRRPVIVSVMIFSAAMAFGIGFASALAYPVLVVAALVYSVAIQLDSAALTAGAVEAAESGRRGATMAVHSVVGFGCAAVGPLAAGAVLDFSGGSASSLSWGIAFASVGVIGLLGPLAMRLVPRTKER